ncbi:MULTISPECIES: tetratricopeptide repeat protein [Thalassospira]|uniref:protein O-GlcNAc transferase n=1 Tax=Thalassospira xiamenensis TaxID=220697 RepID=A0ABR5Y1R4_9PROT|nr:MULTISPECIES: tetratricopeptide repeat protein [Thalassospira]KZD03305.1 hypothetical protein AUP40_17895 [Thalassospira xiamenensis]KZD07711.1 hypothetical protein AUP45_18250 [Thalassospira xiamenensis]MCD1592890.1 tetratricopeptide repeat protein [Thalassospira xiamenensis]MDM7974830.1 tetratricopeptide repeat protein [Thalassospira xiamenensis]OCK06417.1 Tetratricopeptide repeat-containing protein [Thalassospira sp. KO164]
MKLSFDQVRRRAKSLERQGSKNEAIKLYEEFLESYPKNERARKALAELKLPAEVAKGSLQEKVTAVRRLFDSGQIQASFDAANAVLKEVPNSGVVWNLLGAAAFGLKKFDLAEQSFRKAVELEPEITQAHANLGVLLYQQERLQAALEAFANAIKTNPQYAEGYNSIGGIYHKLGKFDAAEKYFVGAIQANKNYAEAYYNLGNTFFKSGKISAAQQSFGFAAQVQGENMPAMSQKLYMQALLCDWSGIADFEKLAPRIGIEGDAVEPFSMLSYDDNAERQQKRAANMIRKRCHVNAVPLPERPVARSEKIKIGYFSADFHDHATLILMIGLLEHHDREKFEIHAYSYGIVKQGVKRDRLSKLVDSFVDISMASDPQIVAAVRQQKIDIAVDLKGFTRQGRSGLFAYRLAPIQISYLGYPGTLGADFMDYIVADKVIIPDNLRQFYTEKVIYLPDSYQPNDRNRIIPETTTTRSDFGLPEKGFVFCCFNSNYKITPREFDIWMRLLAKYDDSVLWLLNANEGVRENLLREVEARGIARERIVFAERLQEPEHLARHKHADLFLDTFNVNAHTTASDALWAGLPIVTKTGESFAARVAASLLCAVGLPELVAETEEQYEALIIDLVENPGRLAQIRQQLIDNRLSAPLFDSATYTKHLEKAYVEAYDRYFEGKEPDHIFVS